jgi:hypothetical protein
MAAIDVVSYCESRENDHGLSRFPPETIGWNAEDTRIRLRSIARAWTAMRSGLPGTASYKATVRQFLVFPKPFGMLCIR